MADNVTLPGTGQVVATKEIAGVEYQVMLMADGTYAVVNPATSDKQDLLLTELQLKADLTETQPVSAATLPLPTGAATSAKQLADDHNVTVSNMIAEVETGLATSAKQLADDHNVTVSNMIAEVETGLATSTKQTDGTQQTRVLDVDGNGIGSSQDSDGNYHLSTTIIQNVNPDPNNSSTTNLAVGNDYTFEGTASSTLGVVGLQWSLKTDQNATVYIEESDIEDSADGTEWDLSRSFNYIAAHGGRGETVQATKAYWRIRVVLTGTIATTYFRLSAVLCPIAMPLPSALSADGRLLTENTITGKENPDRHVWVSPVNGLQTFTTVRLVGTNFDGIVKDTNFWTEAVTNGGTVTQNGEIVLNTEADSAGNGTAKYTSVRKARFVVGSALKFQGLFSFVTAGTVDNVRRCGAYDANNGFFFQLDGTTFSVVSRKATVDTPIASGSFNGNLGTTFTPSTGAGEVYYKLDIEWTPGGAFYYVNGVLLHKSVGGHLTNTLTLPITFENINDNDSDVEIVFDCLGVVIVREGQLATSAIYKYITGVATPVLKYGAGNLHSVTINDNSGSFIIYDGVSAGGTIIAAVDCSKGFGTLTYNAPFSDGLYIATTGAGVKITVIYE